jgi:hypothetical protein
MITPAFDDHESYAVCMYRAYLDALIVPNSSRP